MLHGSIRRAKVFAVSLGALAVAGVVSAAPAHATTVVYVPDNCGYDDAQFFDTNYCTNGLFLYYHQNGAGGFATLQGNISNWSSTVIGSDDYDYIFWYMAGTDTDGAGQGVRNASASASDASSTMTYTVYVSPDDSGNAQSFGPGSGIVNFNSNLDNNGASQSWH